MNSCALEHAKHSGSLLMFMHPATQKPYSPQMVRRLHNEIIREAGLDHIRFADIRYICAVLSLQNGMDTKDVSQMLGNFRIAMTLQNYAPYLACPAAKDEINPTEAFQEELRQNEKMNCHSRSDYRQFRPVGRCVTQNSVVIRKKCIV